MGYLRHEERELPPARHVLDLLIRLDQRRRVHLQHFPAEPQCPGAGTAGEIERPAARVARCRGETARGGGSGGARRTQHALEQKRRGGCRCPRSPASQHGTEAYRDNLPPPWRQPRGKWVVSLVNSYTNATRIGWRVREIDLRFALNSTPGWWFEWSNLPGAGLSKACTAGSAAPRPKLCSEPLGRETVSAPGPSTARPRPIVPDNAAFIRLLVKLAPPQRVQPHPSAELWRRGGSRGCRPRARGTRSLCTSRPSRKRGSAPPLRPTGAGTSSHRNAPHPLAPCHVRAAPPAPHRTSK